jgi:hypothetical protein
MDLLHILYKNIPVFLSIQVLMTFFFLYKSIMTMAKNNIRLKSQSDSEESTITREKKPIKYDDKYKNEYIKLDSRQLTTNEKENLKNNFVMETTPLGNVIMYYNIDKHSFVYYSDSTIPYRFLETVARKYITTFKCKDLTIFIDESDEIDDVDIDADIHEKISIEKPSEVNNATVTYTVTHSTPPLSTTTTKKNVFAKFKNYNHPNSTPSSSMIAKNNPNKCATQSNKEVKENKNKYISEGKIINFSFIKKIDKKQIVKRLNMTFAEFKKMQQESKNKTSL